MMRYQNKVEGAAEDWAWNHMDVANEYCKAFSDTFIKKTGTYDPEYELSKGETAYLLATVMNGLAEMVEVEKENDVVVKTTYKALTIDGMNLGYEMGSCFDIEIEFKNMRLDSYIKK